MLLGEARGLDATIDGALHAERALVVAEPVNDVERCEVVLARLVEQRGEKLHHPVEAQRA